MVRLPSSRSPLADLRAARKFAGGVETKSLDRRARRRQANSLKGVSRDNFAGARGSRSTTALAASLNDCGADIIVRYHTNLTSCDSTHINLTLVQIKRMSSTDPMSTVNENFVPYAHAEKELCDIVGPLLADVIKEVEQRNGIKIRELRVTVEPPAPNALWTGASCVIVR
jgi:hypothetical protein